MFQSLEMMRMAHAMAQHAGTRLAVIAENVANADTPGFRASDLPEFSTIYKDQGLNLKTTRDGHLDPMGRPFVAVEDDGAPQSPDGNTVSIETQMAKAGETRHQHDVALAIYKTSLDILRLSVGRR